MVSCIDVEIRWSDTHQAESFTILLISKKELQIIFYSALNAICGIGILNCFFPRFCNLLENKEIEVPSIETFLPRYYNENTVFTLNIHSGQISNQCPRILQSSKTSSKKSKEEYRTEQSEENRNMYYCFYR